MLEWIVPRVALLAAGYVMGILTMILPWDGVLHSAGYVLFVVFAGIATLILVALLGMLAMFCAPSTTSSRERK